MTFRRETIRRYTVEVSADRSLTNDAAQQLGEAIDDARPVDLLEEVMQECVYEIAHIPRDLREVAEIQVTVREEKP